MATQTDIPPDLTNNDKVFIFQYSDAILNCTILHALLIGIYTGIFAVSLWSICEPGAFLLHIQADVNGQVINKCRSIRRATIVVIILLYALITTDLVAKWSYLNSAFIDNGNNFWTIFLKLNAAQQAVTWEMGVPSFTSTILADLYIVFGVAGWSGGGTDLAFTIRNSITFYYLDAIAAIAKGVAPTLLIGRAAAGHTHPQDESNGSASTVSSIHFQVALEEVGTTTSRGSTTENVALGLETDIEAQHEQQEGLVIIVERI
ncbi:hypothetical protein EDD18DRAFT_1390758 [Armillaria luteobubalina]|uniref:Uncharacterized protein n=1 Tax=Armillaria luteobubalina TaxID=153913 RepID=A0AA39UN18_9AGAR|nr:hypothetical protein EDD18DRAFT_1390758 [Armillaria luteobubalina]